MTRDDLRVLRCEVTLREVEISAAHSANTHVYPHLTGAWDGDGTFGLPQGSGVDGAGPGHRPCLHRPGSHDRSRNTRTGQWALETQCSLTEPSNMPANSP